MTDDTNRAVFGGRKSERALEILNSAPTEELLAERLVEVSGDERLGGFSSTLMQHRSKIGSFSDLAELEGVEGLSADDVAALIDGLNLPTFDFESERLRSVYWTHGAELTIDQPEVFGPIQRSNSGIRVSSFRRELSADPLPFVPGFSWARIAIPAPSFVDGSRFYVRAVLFNFESSPQPFGIKGTPLATPYDIEVWDGHVRIATERISYLPSPSNRYLRVPVESTRRINWGITVAFLLAVHSVPDSADYGFWIDIGAVGVELVTRTGLVVTAVP